MDVAAEAGSFTTLIKALEAADLVKTLSDKGPFTVFAPTDEAFAALPKGTLDDLLKPENKEKLKRVLSYHVVSGELLSQDLKAGKLTTLAEAPVEIVVKDGIQVNDAKVVTPDLKASNGVIHIIDKVILPPEK
ncbi:fasciclin domain-containing protein [Synechococcus sp. H70.2]|uniref:fasciclin domain-containing protein n=1 Tax=unclassified Synechococcus TaxID=2626047 RepID=UPI0039C03E98